MKEGRHICSRWNDLFDAQEYQLSQCLVTWQLLCIEQNPAKPPPFQYCVSLRLIYPSHLIGVADEYEYDQVLFSNEKPIVLSASNWFLDSYCFTAASLPQYSISEKQCKNDPVRPVYGKTWHNSTFRQIFWDLEALELLSLGCLWLGGLEWLRMQGPLFLFPKLRTETRKKEQGTGDPMAMPKIYCFSGHLHITCDSARDLAYYLEK